MAKFLGIFKKPYLQKRENELVNLMESEILWKKYPETSNRQSNRKKT